MICESCKILPSQPGKALCRHCEQLQADVNAEAESAAYQEQFGESRYSQEQTRQSHKYFVGYLKSHNEVEDTESLGLKLLRSVMRREDFSFYKKSHHFQVRSDKQELVYVIFPGRIRKNLVLTEGNKVSVTGYRNNQNQFIARQLDDLDANITYRTTSFSFLVALMLVFLYLLLVGLVTWIYYTLFGTYIITMIIFLVLLILPFKKQNKE